MAEWKPTTLEELEAIISTDLTRCSEEQRAEWERRKVNPRPAAIERCGATEYVFIVAVRGREAIYWEDVEEGFNISRLGADGEILEHCCNQDELGWALNRWLRSDVRPEK